MKRIKNSEILADKTAVCFGGAFMSVFMLSSILAGFEDLKLKAGLFLAYCCFTFFYLMALKYYAEDLKKLKEKTFI